MSVSKGLEEYGWRAKTHSELNSSLSFSGHKQTSFIQHELLVGNEEETNKFTLNVGGFFLASNNILIPEAPKGSWLVPQMVSLKQRGFIPVKESLNVDFTESELNYTINSIKQYLDEHMCKEFETNIELYAALVWLNSMVYEEVMFDFIVESEDNLGNINILKHMAGLQPKYKPMTTVFQEAVKYLELPYGYASRMLMKM